MNTLYFPSLTHIFLEISYSRATPLRRRFRCTVQSSLTWPGIMDYIYSMVCVHMAKLKNFRYKAFIDMAMYKGLDL